METSQRIAWGTVLYQAVVAGIEGAFTIDAFLWLTTVLPAHSNMVAFWQYIASVVVGDVAFSAPSYAALGLATNVAVAVGWAGGYAYFVATRPSTNRHWLAAGAAYGVVVYVLMQLILLAGGHFKGPATPNAFVIIVIAHVVFFGIPVAYVVRTLDKTRAA
jgi:hypothetical protein